MSRRSFYADLVERTLWTALQAFLAALIVVDGETSLQVAALAAAAAAVKAVVAVNLPWTAPDSASTLPAAVDPPADG
jgi:CTP:molybdopterin cytidylyltransferase MocA